MSMFSLFNKPKQNNIKPQFQVGQEWYYQTRPNEENSTVKIVKTETYKEIGNLIHISISGVKIKNPKYPNGVLEEVLHLPIAEEALQKSTTQLKNNRTDLPNYEFGYVRWKTAFDEEKAGYFAIPLREVIQYLEDGTYDVK